MTVPDSFGFQIVIHHADAGDGPTYQLTDTLLSTNWGTLCVTPQTNARGKWNYSQQYFQNVDGRPTKSQNRISLPSPQKETMAPHPTLAGDGKHMVSTITAMRAERDG